jgi:hypothetical protein
MFQRKLKSIFSYPEDGDSSFTWNTGNDLPNQMMSHPRKACNILAMRTSNLTIIMGIQLLGQFGRNQSSVRQPVWLWYAASWFLRVACHCFPLPLDVPTFAARCLHVLNNARDPSSKRWNYGREMSSNFAYMTSLFTPLGIYYMPQIYDMGPMALLLPLKEGMLRIFLPLKIRQLWPGLNPRTWVLKASMLPLDHRSRVQIWYTFIIL